LCNYIEARKFLKKYRKKKIKVCKKKAIFCITKVNKEYRTLKQLVNIHKLTNKIKEFRCECDGWKIHWNEMLHLSVCTDHNMMTHLMRNCVKCYKLVIHNPDTNIPEKHKCVALVHNYAMMPTPIKVDNCILMNNIDNNKIIVQIGIDFEDGTNKQEMRKARLRKKLKQEMQNARQNKKANKDKNRLVTCEKCQTQMQLSNFNKKHKYGTKTCEKGFIADPGETRSYNSSKRNAKKLMTPKVNKGALVWLKKINTLIEKCKEIMSIKGFKEKKEDIILNFENTKN
jgi:hypothetical protein